MTQRNIYSIAVAAFAFMGGATAPFTPVQSTTPKPLQLAQSTPTIAAIENSVHQQINQLRSSQSLPPLTRNSAIDNQARIHSQNMASGKVPFSHTGFSQRITATRISYSSAAENIARNSGYSDPATQAVQGWRFSSGHFQNIRGNYNLTGIGVARNNKGEYFFTQIFIRSR